jgi:hypothetical protein
LGSAAGKEEQIMGLLVALMIFNLIDEMAILFQFGNATFQRKHGKPTMIQ